MESKVCLTLKFTPHTRPKCSNAQMLVPKKTAVEELQGVGKEWAPRTRTPKEVFRREAVPHGFAVTERHTQYKNTLKGTPLARPVSAAEKDTHGVFSSGPLVFCALGSLVFQELSKFGHTQLQLRILGRTQTDPASPRVTQMEAVNQRPTRAATAAARNLEVWHDTSVKFPENGFTSLVCTHAWTPTWTL